MNLNHLAIFHAVAQAGSMTLGQLRDPRPEKLALKPEGRDQVVALGVGDPEHGPPFRLPPRC
jgi:hypothetical protein